MEGRTPIYSDLDNSNGLIDEVEESQELLTFTVDAPEPIRQMVDYIISRYKEIFPKMGGKRYLHPHKYERTLEKLRSMF